MLVQTLIVTALFYLALYPKRTGWGIEHVRIKGVIPYFEWKSFLLMLMIDLHLSAKVRIENPNAMGSLLERARYEVFVAKGKFTGVRLLGQVSVGRNWIAGVADGPTSVEAEVDLQALDVPTALRMLVEILRQGQLQILALGTAQVLSLNSIQTLVGIRCVESLSISFLSSSFASLTAGVSHSCEYSYQPLSRSVAREPLLPFLDRHYVFSSFPSYSLPTKLTMFKGFLPSYFTKQKQGLQRNTPSSSSNQKSWQI